MDEEKLIEKLRLIEALHSGSNIPGERRAAQSARERIRERLRKIQGQDRAGEYQFSMPDVWSRKLFLALARRYELTPYRYPRQRHTTVMIRVPRSFVDETLWPEFQELNRTLRAYLNDITTKVIRESIHGDSSEAEVRNEPMMIASGNEISDFADT
jgi:hypothetical protein